MLFLQVKSKAFWKPLCLSKLLSGDQNTFRCGAWRHPSLYPDPFCSFCLCVICSKLNIWNEIIIISVIVSLSQFLLAINLSWTIMLCLTRNVKIATRFNEPCLEHCETWNGWILQIELLSVFFNCIPVESQHWTFRSPSACRTKCLSLNHCVQWNNNVWILCENYLKMCSWLEPETKCKQLAHDEWDITPQLSSGWDHFRSTKVKVSDPDDIQR